MLIVGVVRDVIHRSPRDPARPVLYAPAAQETFALSPASILVRSSTTPAKLLGSVRQAAATLDPDIALFDVKTFEQQVGETIWAERLLAHAAGGFGVAALVLAGLGLFGALSQRVTRGAREIAVRIAIGAEPRALRLAVVRESLWLCAAGMMAGVPLAFAASRAVRTLLYGTEPGDWRALLAAAAVLFVTAALAAYVPARRASRTDPMQVLRE
jgi:ABC-type antimicrobial peptide transport system permease subunit